MTRFDYTLNQIFYGYKKFDDSDKIHSFFSPFFFDPTNIHTLVQKSIQESSTDTCIKIESSLLLPKSSPVLSSPVLSSPVPKSSPVPVSKSEEWFRPNKPDTLFWCIFRHVFGKIEYIQIKNRYGNRLLEEKQKIMENFLAFPKKLKECSNIKFTNARVQETCSEFMCEKKTSPLALAGYAVYYGIDIYLVDREKHTYIKFLCNKDSEISSNSCWIYKDNSSTHHSKYMLKLSDTVFDVNAYCCLEQFDKPLLGISHYKIHDLENLEKLLGIVHTKSQTKNERYTTISKHMAWVW
jgi:hypothetical protein